MSKSKQRAIKRVVVIGSAHLDILAEATRHTETIDKPGTLDVQIGGTAYNVAVNLATANVPVTLVTAMNKSLSINRLIGQTLAQQKVEFAYEHNANLGQSGFSAQLIDGDMVSAVAAVNVDQHEFSDEFMRAQIQGADIVVVECNLSAATLQQVAGIAGEEGASLAACVVSESKALRLADAGVHPRYLFANQVEADYLRQHDGNVRRGEVEFVTRGANGVYVGCDLGGFVRPARIVTGDGQQQYMGAGDAFAAGALQALLNDGADIEGAVIRGQHFASEVIEHQHCNRGAPDVFNTHIARLEADASLDALTGLNNRRSAQQWFDTLARGKDRDAYSFFMLDIDKFKSINDTHGHAVGDDVIKAVSAVLRDQLREEDIGVRWGGEEFLVAMKAPLASAQRVGERLLAAVREMRFPSCPELNNKVTVSIGLAPSASTATPEEVIEKADEALYTAKRSGRNRMVMA